MLYFDPAVVTDFVEAEGVTGIEVVRPRGQRPAIGDPFRGSVRQRHQYRA
jgi:hypothetical protein